LKLNHASRAGLGRLTKRNSAQVRSEVGVCRVIERVQHVSLHLELLAFSETEVLSERKVEVPQAGRSHARGIDVAPPHRSDGCPRDVDAVECGWIDVVHVVKAATLHADYLFGVDHVRTASRMNDTCEDWYARSGCEYAGNVPAAQTIPRQLRAFKQPRY